MVIKVKRLGAAWEARCFYSAGRSPGILIARRLEAVLVCIGSENQPGSWRGPSGPHRSFSRFTFLDLRDSQQLAQPLCKVRWLVVTLNEIIDESI